MESRDASVRVTEPSDHCCFLGLPFPSNIFHSFSEKYHRMASCIDTTCACRPKGILTTTHNSSATDEATDDNTSRRHIYSIVQDIVWLAFKFGTYTRRARKAHNELACEYTKRLLTLSSLSIFVFGGSFEPFWIDEQRHTRILSSTR